MIATECDTFPAALVCVCFRNAQQAVLRAGVTPHARQDGVCVGAVPRRESGQHVQEGQFYTTGGVEAIPQHRWVLVQSLTSYCWALFFLLIFRSVKPELRDPIKISFLSLAFLYIHHLKYLYNSLSQKELLWKLCYDVYAPSRLRCITLMSSLSIVVFMPPPFEDWWRGIKCYPCPSVIKIWFPLNNFWKTASIQFKFGMLIYNIKTQVKFDLGYNSLIFDGVKGFL